ncbi:TetR/AcrR family transcriptional regulator [Thiomicrorhabdus indica]|uniref:TetR/AcrR family transcriptional regulator n=1 Tax=Thiomicrorhabdus indica TaxID=2267253 RepID=UPI00102DE8FA|nr:TetR/AcrR family transcriptional regulator [Thiomicrorhabdus indica]
MDTYHRILEAAAELFAQHGYEAVTMRDIAKASNIKAPSLYNHFQDKQHLYQTCLQWVFRQHNDQLTSVFNSDTSTESQLKSVIQLSLAKMTEDENFRLLIQRELLQNDKTRLQFLAHEVMYETCQQMEGILKNLAPNADHHFLITTLMGLVMFHVQIGPMREFLPSSDSKHHQLEYLSEGIFKLFIQNFH